MPADLAFVQTYYADLQRQMHDCREAEHRLLTLGLLFNALALAACALAATSPLPVAALIVVAMGTAPLCVLVTLYCVERVRRERTTYENLGGICQRIWSFYQLSDAQAYGAQEPLMPESQALRYGKGLGHLRAMMLLRIVGYTVAVMVLMIGLSAMLMS